MTDANEARARARAAKQMHVSDKTGASLPDEIWMQCLPPSTLVGMILRLRANLAAMPADDMRAELARANETVARLREALLWCAEMPLADAMEMAGATDEEVRVAQIKWLETAPDHYNETIDAARAALEADNG